MLSNKLTQKLRAFLKDRKTCVGGFFDKSNDVSKERSEFREIIDLILKEKFEEDYSNDLPLEVNIYDRTRERRPYQAPIRYVSDMGVEELEDALDDALFNLNTAHERVALVNRCLRLERRICKEKREERKKKQNGE